MLLHSSRRRFLCAKLVVVEGNSGTTQATFVVALSGPTSQSVSFSFATANGTAIAGSDYIAASGALTFAPGEVEKPVVVLVNGDTVDEVQETYFLDISNVQNATVSSSRGNGVIVDDDGPTVSINDVSCYGRQYRSESGHLYLDSLWSEC